MTGVRMTSHPYLRTFACVFGAVALSALTSAQQSAPPGSAFQLPPELMQRDLQLAELAAEAAGRGPVTPIPLYNGSRIAGVVYDQYFMGVVIARAEIAAGRLPVAKSIVAHPAWQSRGTLIVAYPVDCNGRPNEPLAIRWNTTLKLPISPEPIAGPMKGSAAQALLPGTSLPESALVVNLRNAVLAGNVSVEVDYAGPVCQGAAKTAVMPITNQPSQAFRGAAAYLKLPQELTALSPATVRVQTVLDPTGRMRFPQQVQGPPELLPLVLAQINSMTAQPWTMNGVAVPMNLMRAFVLTTTGDPAPPAPFNAGPPMPASSGSSAPGARSVTTDGVMVTLAPRPPVQPAQPVPPPPPGQSDAQLARLAIEIAAKGDPVPVPLDASGDATRGVIFDRFLIAALRARAAVKAGTPLDPASASADQMRDDLVVVAYPLLCDGRKIAPDVIELTAGGTRPGAVAQRGSLLTGPVLQERLPGAVLAEGAVGQPFVNIAFNQNLEVRVTYYQPVCGSTGRSLSYPIQWVLAQGLPRMTTARLPSASSLPSPSQVRLRGLVDLDGTYRFPTLADGPSELGTTALATASQWKFQPSRANGVAMPVILITTLTFTTSGQPEPAGTTAGSTPPAASPPVISSSTLGGRSTTDLTSEAVPGLTAATSKCEVAADARYGLTTEAPIKIGGDFTQGPQRQRQFLSVLRGPSGEGLRIVRRGAILAPDKQTILDLYEATYAGLASPLRLYLDQYHEESPLKAPMGLTCASPIGR